MARASSWRRTCPDSVRRTLDELQGATVYLLHQTGPTGFVVKAENNDKKCKVLLGDPHHCTCSEFTKNKELCIHLLWILVKKFRLTSDDPLVFQLGLVEREVNSIIHKDRTKQTLQSAKNTDGDSPSTQGNVPQRPLTQDDLCPICQEELLGSPNPLTYCKRSCGQSMHVKCMKVWADHQRNSNGEEVVKCPLCREEFGPYEELRRGVASAACRKAASQSQNLHQGTSCDNCGQCPIAGRCYRCTVCPGCCLCHQCYSSSAANAAHHQHDFEYKMHPSHRWRPAERPPLVQQLPSALVRDLEAREITEDDYDMLLQLDRDSSRSTRSSVPQFVLQRLPVEPLDRGHPLLEAPAECCGVCMRQYTRGDWVKKLPCGHPFHRECIDTWLSSAHHSCPLDGISVHNPMDQSRTRKKKKKSAGKQAPIKKPPPADSLPDLLSVHSYPATTGHRHSLPATCPVSRALQRHTSVGRTHRAELSVSGLSMGGQLLGPSERSMLVHTAVAPCQINKKMGTPKRTSTTVRLPPLPPRTRPARSTLAHDALSVHASGFVLHSNH